MSLAGSRGGAPLWGLGQRPNCCAGDQFQGSRQQRCRQRSVPASNFALPQERPQAALSNLPHIVAPNGRDHIVGLATIVALFRKQGFRACGRESARAHSLKVRSTQSRNGCREGRRPFAESRGRASGGGKGQRPSVSPQLHKKSIPDRHYRPAGDALIFPYTISKFTCAICSRLFRACVRSFHLA
jgi:hypothetical protein